MPNQPTYHTGEPVICRVFKRSTHPGPRARSVRPEVSGEGYSYEVDKFWAVREVRGREVVLITRRGKTHVVDAADPTLRPAKFWERILYRDRFPVGPDAGGATA